MSIKCINFFRELVKRLDPELPFYLWTAREPYQNGLVPFDGDGHDRQHQRLHRLRCCAREDPAIFVAGRALIPARHAQHLRQRLYRPMLPLLNPRL